MTGGNRGIAGIPRPFEDMETALGRALLSFCWSRESSWCFYVAIERAWQFALGGASMRAIRENEEGGPRQPARMSSLSARMSSAWAQPWMGLAGGLMAH